MYISTNDLPNEIKSALCNLGYTKANIEVQFRESYTLFSVSGDGKRGMTVICKDGSYDARMGSWGGSNPFQKNQVDSDDTEYPLDVDTFVIKGNSGNGVYAYLVMHKDNKFGIKETEAKLISDRQKKILYLYKGLTSAGRKDYLVSMKVTQEEIDQLVAMRLLEKKGRGIGITTEGKNNCANGVFLNE